MPQQDLSFGGTTNCIHMHKTSHARRLKHTHTHTHTHIHTHTRAHARMHSWTHVHTHIHTHTHTTTLFPISLFLPLSAIRAFKVPSTYRSGTFSILSETLSCTSRIPTNKGPKKVFHRYKASFLLMSSYKDIENIIKGCPGIKFKCNREFGPLFWWIQEGDTHWFIRTHADTDTHSRKNARARAHTHTHRLRFSLPENQQLCPFCVDTIKDKCHVPNKELQSVMCAYRSMKLSLLVDINTCCS